MLLSLYVPVSYECSFWTLTKQNLHNMLHFMNHSTFNGIKTISVHNNK